MLGFRCIDKLLRYLLRSICFPCRNCKTGFYYTCQWQDMIQAWWDCLVMSWNIKTQALCIVPLLSMNCLFKWLRDSLYLISFKVDQSSPSADFPHKSDGWTVILEVRKISCFIFSCNINFWIFTISIYPTAFLVNKRWLSCSWRLSYQMHSCISWSQYLTFSS